MPTYHSVKPDYRLMGRLDHGADLLEELTRVCQAGGIQLATVEAIGAVRKARLGFYDQTAREYRFTEYDQPMEIVNLSGNVSIKDSQPMVHAHVTLAAEDGRTIGGHLAEGTEVFACEFVLHVLSGPAFVRGVDEPTGLPLWALTPSD